MNKHLKIGLFGYGCVGQGLYDILEKTKSITAEVSKICVKQKDKKRDLPMDYFTFDKNELLNDESLNVIVEVIDNADDAFEIVKTAMENGKHVVSANKKMIAEHFKEIVDLQEKYGVSFLYEASSCASIPIIRNLEEYYDNDLLDAFEGIFNGSTNYILSKMISENKDYSVVLKDAQDLGFAESDPSLDVEGLDAKYKLCILTAHAFGLVIPPSEVFTYGIQNINSYELKYAKEKGLKIKLFASSKLIDGKLATWVMPQFTNKSFKLYNVEDEYNGVVMEGAFSDAQQLIGKGAGSHPTGSAVISDISALTYNYKYEYKKYHRNKSLERHTDFLLEIYLRYKDESVLNDLTFESIEERYQSKGFNYIIGTIKLNQLMNAPITKNPDVFIAQTDKNVRELI